MPYIDPADRWLLDPWAPVPVDGPGKLNFQITVTIRNYIQGNGLSYRTINDVLGALEGAKQEFYRRIAAPYEDKKIVANGDVYPQEWVQ